MAKEEWLLLYCLNISIKNVEVLISFTTTNLNLFSQELNAPNMYETSVALNGLACFMYPDLARDIANDMMSLVSYHGYLTSTQPASDSVTSVLYDFDLFFFQFAK